MASITIENKLKAIEMYKNKCTLKKIGDIFHASAPLILYWVKNEKRLLEKLQKNNSDCYEKRSNTHDNNYNSNNVINSNNNEKIKRNFNKKENIKSPTVNTKTQNASTAFPNSNTNSEKNVNKFSTDLEDKKKQFLLIEYKSLKSVYDIQMEKVNYLMVEDSKFSTKSTEEAFQIEKKLEEYNNMVTNLVERIKYLETILSI